MAGTQAGETHWLPGAQSLLVWQGQAHLPTAVLQRWVMQVASVWQGNAMAPGVLMPPAVGCAVGCGCPYPGCGWP
jgi:hypothetical protein